MAYQPSENLKSKPFLAFIGTQFLGAFNDNVYKQIMLLFAVSMAATAGGADKQGTITMIFSLPFILFSSYSGQIAEKMSKSRIMFICKLLELVIMVLGTIAFYLQSFQMMVGILFFMGAQSALFGPSKLGGLPEIIVDKKLTAANGWVQMTTFVAIILGTALAGYLMRGYRETIYIAGFACIAIAILGIFTVLGLPKLNANRPETKMNPNPFGRVFQTLIKMKRDPILMVVLIANCFFWYSGVMVVQIVNNYGMYLLKLKEDQISMMLVTLSVGIMIGCVFTDFLVRKMGPVKTVVAGALGVAFSQMSLYFYHMPFAMIHGLLGLAGACSGLYYVPLATALQSRPPLGEKGEVLAAMNFLNFVAMFLAGTSWGLFNKTGWSANVAWPLLGLMLILLMFLLGARIRIVHQMTKSPDV